MRKNGVSDGGPTAKTAKSNNPEAAPTVATTLAIITLAGEASYAPQPIQSLVFEAEPITAEAYTDVFGTTPAFEASYSRFPNRVRRASKASFTVPIGPWRCFETITSAVPNTWSMRVRQAFHFSFEDGSFGSAGGSVRAR